jgi:hypothetical protein
MEQITDLGKFLGSEWDFHHDKDIRNPRHARSIEKLSLSIATGHIAIIQWR